MSDSVSRQTRCRVICVCGGYGFPLGTASAARITIVGKTLQAAGIGFHLLHCGPSPLSINTQRSGVYSGISFEYTTCTRRPENRLARLLVYVWAVCNLTARLARLRQARRSTLVYLYLQDGLLNLYIGCLCRLLGLAIVQELCEWPIGEPSTCSVCTRFLYRKRIFKLAAGALVISKEIENRVRQRCAQADLPLLIHRLPVLVDTQRFAAVSPMADGPDPRDPSFLYCGTWRKDVYFLIRAFSRVRQQGCRCKLKIVGGCVADSGREILQYAREKGLTSEDLVLAGTVDEATLQASYKTATALLMPLWNDDRSVTRLPNKLGEYLASGRPVVASNIGDLTELLADNQSAYLAKPGDEHDFAGRMIAVLEDPDRAQSIGAAGRRVCVAHLDYRAHVSGLADFFLHCLADYNGRRFARKQAGQIRRRCMGLRNVFCGLLALALIASGRVRRARSRALTDGAVTAIYFHKPNKKLLARCVGWLARHGYTFITAHELLDILYGGKTPPKGAVWLSFDDGFKELLEDVLPLIRRRKIPVTLFIPSGIVEGEGLLPWLHAAASGRVRNGIRDTLTAAELQHAAAYPEVTIGSHTVSHAVTVGLTEEKARFELGQSKRTLESWTHAGVTAFAYPEGRFDGREKPFLAEFGYLLAATTENALITRQTDPYLVPRFGVGDQISFPEAICNLVGVWRPAIDPVIRFLRRSSKITGLLWNAQNSVHS
jgi:glycosyltransferase involved in cell wall biosynthesis/peptidoglycan/xylan/chitin deacetylase (PgdA/CDA1 family)